MLCILGVMLFALSSAETAGPTCLSKIDTDLPLGLRPRHPLQSSANGKVVKVYGITDVLGAIGDYQQDQAVIVMHGSKNGSVQLYLANDTTEVACVSDEHNFAFPDPSTWIRPEQGKLFVACAPDRGGFFTPICHSHFQADGTCAVFALRSEFTGRLVNVALKEDSNGPAGSLNALGPRVWDMDATDFDFYMNSFICVDTTKPIVDQMPTYALRVELEGKNDPEYVGLDSNGDLTLVSAKDLPIAGPEQFYRIINSDGTTSLRSKAKDSTIVVDMFNNYCDKLHLRSQYKYGFEIFSSFLELV